jgi:hypothetical protein
MLLQVVPEEGQDVLPEDIHYYGDQPFDDGNYLAQGVDRGERGLHGDREWRSDVAGREAGNLHPAASRDPAHVIQRYDGDAR